MGAVEESIQMTGTDDHHFSRTATTDKSSNGLQEASLASDGPLLPDLRQRQRQTGLFHLNTRMDLLHAAHGPPDKEPAQDPHLVHFEGLHDPESPQNWSALTKISQTILLASCTTIGSFSSSVFSSALDPVSREFGISVETASLGSSLFLIGYVSGPCVFGPASELYGRRLPFIVSFFCFTLFNIPVAVAQNVETIMLGRWLCGFFASGPLVIICGALADFTSPEKRGAAIAVYAFFSTAGPAIGPLIGNFIVDSYLGWRWTQYITLIWGMAQAMALLLFMKESYAPVILQKRANRLRRETGNWQFHSKLDEHQLDWREIVTVYLVRPYTMLADPVLLIVTIYSSFIYGLLYLCFGAVPFSFAQRGLSPGTIGVTFVALLLGALCGSSLILVFVPRYNRVMHERHVVAVPEERCLPMALGGAIFPIGFFLFGWTSVEYCATIWPQIVALYLIGVGFLLIFLSSINLLVDYYLLYASSAIAANTAARAAVAAGFTLCSRQLYANLGTQWASTLLGCLALVFSPFAPLFMRYSAWFSSHSKYTSPADVHLKMDS